MNSGRKYFESAIADAIRLGDIPRQDAVIAARRVQSAFLGTLIEAKVQNDVEILRDLEPTILSIIGATKGQPQAA